MATIKEKKRDKFRHSSAALEKNKGQPKKQGGGKANWGKPGDEIRGSSMDPNDPLYDSFEEAEVVYVEYSVEPQEQAQKAFVASIEQMEKCKKALRATVEEFLLSFDKEEFVRCVKELNLTIYHQEIPKIAILASLDKSEDIRRKISSLLEYLHQHDILSSLQLEAGLRHLFNRLDDLRLDVPTAETLLKQFVLRAVASECLTEAVANKLTEKAEVTHNPDEVKSAKSRVREIAVEYFESEDLAEAEQSIVEMKSPAFHHEVVKQVISTSMDRSSRERELASYLIEAMTGTTLASDEVERAFEILLQRVEDLYNDVPRVLEYLSCFLARAVSEEVLPPAFLSRVNIMPTDMGSQVVKQAGVLLNEKHAAARLARVWGPGDGRSVYGLKKAVKDLANEYFESSDATEAIKCIKDLNAGYFHHEVVYRIVVLSFDKKEREVKLVSELLNLLASQQVLSKNQLRMGFDRVRRSMEDLVLDSPDAPKIFAQIEASVPLN